MNVRQWYEATSAWGADLSREERDARRAERLRVVKAAGTTENTLRVALCRQKAGLGKIGDGLLVRLRDATKGERNKILWKDERKEPPRA